MHTLNTFQDAFLLFHGDFQYSRLKVMGDKLVPIRYEDKELRDYKQ